MCFRCFMRSQGFRCRLASRLTDYPGLTWSLSPTIEPPVPNMGLGLLDIVTSLPVFPSPPAPRAQVFPQGGVRKMHPSPSCFSVVHRRLIMWLSWRWLLPKASVLKTSCSELRPLVCAGTGHFFTLCSKREDMGLYSPEDKRFSVWWPTPVF